MKQTAPSARRFVTLRASANNVMRKLEAHGLLAPVTAAVVMPVGCHPRLCYATATRFNLVFLLTVG